MPVKLAPLIEEGAANAFDAHPGIEHTAGQEPEPSR